MSSPRKRGPRVRNKEQEAAYMKGWRARNPEKIAANTARATAKGAEKYQQKMADPVQREKQLRYTREHGKQPRLKLIAALGGRCAHCGLEDIRALHIDHVRGNGAEERRVQKGYGYYKSMLANVASGDYQVLCASCNTIKRHDCYEYAPKSPVKTRDTRPLPTDPKELANLQRRRADYDRWSETPGNLEEKRLATKRQDLENRTKVLSVLGGKCVSCGLTDPRALNIDHVHGDGSADRKKAHGKKFHNQVIAAVAAGSDSYQLLCASCNWIKRAVNNETTLGRVYGPRRGKSDPAPPSSAPA